MQWTCRLSYRTASRFTRFIRYTLHFNNRSGEGSGNAYIMPKADSHCPLILLISDNAMIFRLYIHIPLNVGWLIFRQYRKLVAGDKQS